MNGSAVPPVVAVYDNSKPREERDFHEIYPDLDELTPLRVFIQTEEFTDEEPGYSIPNLNKPSFKKIKVERTESRFPKALAEYGFGNQSNRNPLNTYVRPEQRILGKSNQVGYDMDEQDFLYLEERNLKHSIKITAEVFEVLITVLENEWELLEQKMSKSGPIDDDAVQNMLLILHTNNDKYGNDDGIVPGSIYDQKCAVCNDSDCDNSNAIVFCDGCDIAVHQECYGIAFIPEGQWYCRKCMINKSETSCVFCPSTTGAFKQLDNSLWSHVVCAMWINELYFANPVYMEPIEGMDLIPRSRWKLLCYICKQRVGACVQCSNRGCFQAYHVTCAKRAQLYMEFTQGVTTAITNKLTLKSFCDRHLPAHVSTETVLSGIMKTRLFYRDTKLLLAENAKLTQSQRNANKLNIFKWKTENHQTPVAPKIFSDILLDILVKLKVERQGQNNQVRGLSVPRSKEEVNKELREITDEICRIWCLKKELKRGAPLIRKSTGTGSSGGSSERLEFGKLLQDDLSRLIGMNELVLQRQKLMNEEINASLATVNAVYFPLTECITNTLENLNRKWDPLGLLQSYKGGPAEVPVGEGPVTEDVPVVEKVPSENKRTPHLVGTESLDEDTPLADQNIPVQSKDDVHDDSRSNGSDLTKYLQSLPKDSPEVPQISLSTIIHKNSTLQYNSVGSFLDDLEQLHTSIREISKSPNTIRVANKWMSQLHKVLPELHEFEAKVGDVRAFDFDVLGADVRFVKTNLDRKAILEEQGLSDVDLDENGANLEIDTKENEALLKKFLTG